MRILLVEDDMDLSRRFSDRMHSAGFVVEHSANAEAALAWSDMDSFAAIVVDLGLPDMDGNELIKNWRQNGLEVPILVLSARGSWEEKVLALNLGADDYVVKPVRAEEIVARLNALIRRAGGRSTATIGAGDLELNTATKSAFRHGEQIELTKMEYRLLRLFIQRAGHILSQTEILDHLYPYAEVRDTNTIEVHVGRLRRKIGRSPIKTIRGLGYRFEK